MLKKLLHKAPCRRMQHETLQQGPHPARCAPLLQPLQCAMATSAQLCYDQASRSASQEKQILHRALCAPSLLPASIASYAFRSLAFSACMQHDTRQQLQQESHHAKTQCVRLRASLMYALAAAARAAPCNRMVQAE